MEIPTTLRRVAETIPRPKLPLRRSRHGVRRLDADLYETPDAFLALFDAPGANQSDIQLKFVEGAILVRIDRFRDPHPGFEMRFAGRKMSSDGQVDLPRGATVVPEDAAATLSNDGTLRVRVPKEGARVTDASPDEDGVTAPSA